MRGQTPTIYTVADQAGVSVATVSRVLKGHSSVSDETRARVLAAVEAVGYQPLRRTRERRASHGVVVDSLAEPQTRALLLGMQGDAGVARLVLSCEGLGDQAAVDDAVEEFAAGCDGLVVPAAGPSNALLAELAEQLPVVLVGREPVTGCDDVSTDQAAPMRELVAGLIELGRTRPVFIGDPGADRAVRLRHEGYQQALAAAGITPAARIQVSADAAGADAALPSLLKLAGEVDVAVCASDDLALRLLHVLVWRGISVPDDLAVTGWGDEPGASYVVPRLTSIADPMAELGALVSARLGERQGRRGLPPTRRTLLPHVCWRESTGRP